MSGHHHSTETDPGRPRRPREIEESVPESSPLPTVSAEEYDVEGEIARGGMGRILRATDRRLGRPVAIKQLLDTNPRNERLFEREVRITARLQHPAIVNVYEAGRLASGELFYAMKLVAGRALVDVIRDRDSLHERMALLPAVLGVCDALAYAHEHRIIHRDLKPHNVLVGDFGETVVIDWGLAKDMAAPSSVTPGDGDDEADPAHTVSGTAVGTPAYMPPEQARGVEVDERSDVYSLGAILYHLLAGRPPYDGDSSRDVLDKVLAGPPRPLHEVEPDVPGDLLALVDRAMSRDPADRYTSALSLAEDLRRYQTGKLVTAHRYSRRELALRWLGRHRAEAIVAAAALVVLAVVSAVGVHRIMRERDLAASRANSLTLTQARLMLERDPAQALNTLQTLPPNSSDWGAVRVIAAAALDRGVGAVRARHARELTHVAWARDGAFAAAADDGEVVLYESDGTAGHRWAHTGPITALVFDSSGARVASASRDATILLHDRRTGSDRALTDHDLPVVALRISADGRFLGSTDSGGRSIVRDLTNDDRAIVDDRAAIAGLTLPGDDAAVVTVSPDGVARRWGFDGAVLTEQQLGVADVVAASTPDGSHFVATTTGGRAFVAGDGPPRQIATLSGPVHRLVLAPGGTRALIAPTDRGALLWSFGDARGEELAPGDGAVAAAFVGGDDLVALGGRDGAIRLCTATGEPVRVLRGHGGAITGLTASTDGRLLSSSSDRTVREWRALPLPTHTVAGPPGGVSQLQFVADSHKVIAGGLDGRVMAIDTDSGERVELGHHAGAVRALAVARDGRTIVTGGDDRAVWSWLPTGGGARLGAHQGAVTAIAISASGELVASGGRDNIVHVWPADGGASQQLVGHSGAITSVALSNDGTLAASTSTDGTARLWTLRDGSSAVIEHDDTVVAAAFSPDGTTLATAGLDHAVRVTDIATQRTRTWRGHAGPVRDLAFSADGRLLASASDDMTARVWQVSTGVARAYVGHRDYVTRTRFDRRGALVTASEDGDVMIWDLRTGARRELRPTAWVNDVALAADGTRIAANGSSPEIFVWRDELPTDAKRLRAWLRTAAPPNTGPQGAP